MFTQAWAGCKQNRKKHTRAHMRQYTHSNTLFYEGLARFNQADKVNHCTHGLLLLCPDRSFISASVVIQALSETEGKLQHTIENYLMRNNTNAASLCKL